MSRILTQALMDIITATGNALTDEDQEQLIAFLQDRMEHPRYELLVLEELKKLKEKYHDVWKTPSDMKLAFFESNGDEEVELRIGVYDRVDWNWIYEELKKDEHQPH